MAVKKGQQHIFTISDIAFGGKGLVKMDGFAIFVDQAVPGDKVEARIVRKKRSYAEARVVQLLEPSPDRIQPPCPYSGICGGCKWQFLSYEKQLAYKQQHVRESLEHIGGLSGMTIHPVIASEKQFGYRNKMEFSCSDRRWLLPDELGDPEVKAGFALGLHVPGTYYKVLNTDACLLQPDMGNRILEDVRGYMKSSGLPVYGLKTHEGFWRFLMLRHSVALDQWMVNIITATENLEGVRPLAEMLVARYPEVRSVVNNVTSRRSGVAIGEYEVHLAGETRITDRIGGYDFDISANSFFQTNTRAAETLYAVVKQYAELKGGETIVDLYSGTGTIAIYLSDSAESIIGLEIVESAVSDARSNCQRNGIDNCTFQLGDIRFSLSQIEHAPDVMIIDPPRAGMHKDVVKQILSILPEKIVYVSCNPATMARDLSTMKDAYNVMEVQPVDMFPHTYHIESVAKLRKKSRLV